MRQAVRSDNARDPASVTSEDQSRKARRNVIERMDRRDHPDISGAAVDGCNHHAQKNCRDHLYDYAQRRGSEKIQSVHESEKKSGNEDRFPYTPGRDFHLSGYILFRTGALSGGSFSPNCTESPAEHNVCRDPAEHEFFRHPGENEEHCRKEDRPLPPEGEAVHPGNDRRDNRKDRHHDHESPGKKPSEECSPRGSEDPDLPRDFHHDEDKYEQGHLKESG